MKKTLLALLLLATAIPLSGCIIAPYPGYGRGGGGCYYQYRCY
jgi:hypothetical protein